MTMATSEPKAPKIEFPCADYPVKIIGHNSSDFIETVMEVVCRHCPDFDRQVEQQASSNARFVSLRIRITAQGADHLARLHEDLRATGMVQMVL